MCGGLLVLWFSLIFFLVGGFGDSFVVGVGMFVTIFFGKACIVRVDDEVSTL